MIYHISQLSTEKLSHIPEEDQMGEGFVVAYLTYTEFVEVLESHENKDSILEEIRSTTDISSNVLHFSEDYSFAEISIVNSHNLDQERDLVAFYMSSKTFVAVEIRDDDNSARECFAATLEGPALRNPSIGRFISAFFRGLISSHPNLFLTLQDEIEKLDDLVLASRRGNYTSQIATLNHTLITLYGYYQQLLELGESILENSNDTMEEGDLNYFRSFVSRVQRYSNQIQLQRDYLNQVRQSYQAQLDLGMNSVMKVLTVITAVFSPLTLATGWYGMNFKYMPELENPYGYIGMILFSITLTLVLILAIKKTRLLK